MRLPDIDINFRLPKPPFLVIAVLLILVVASWVPLAMISKSLVTLSPNTRVHIFHDMDHQPKKKTQTTSIVFADGRSMRQPVPGTVARGELHADDHYWRGFQATPTGENNDRGQPTFQTTYFQGMPDRVQVTDRCIKRGQTEFNVYCYPCHGKGGFGDGPVAQRASGLTSGGWVPPSNLHSTDNNGQLLYGHDAYPDGKLFNTISNGIRNMPGYHDQIPVQDRWAIVTYVRALQLSQQAPREDVPQAQLSKMK